MRRTSPPPRKNPAAFENVGAADTAVAANAPKSPRRVKPVDFVFVIVLAPVPSLVYANSPALFIYPQMWLLYVIR